SEFISLKKEIDRIEFIIYSTISISLFFLPWSQSYLLRYNLFDGDVNSVIAWGLVIVMVTSTIGLIIFSMQRLNSLNLSRYIAYIFIFPNLFIMNIVMIDPLLSKCAWSNVFCNEMLDFSREVAYNSENLTIVLSFVSIILILLLSVLKGINK
ncbi:TPA: hypothetical protein ACPGB8_001653, partial [Haemophilus influenzae]